MTPAARERAFRQEMRAEKNLHPALQTPEGHYKVGVRSSLLAVAGPLVGLVKGWMGA